MLKVILSIFLFGAFTGKVFGISLSLSESVDRALAANLGLRAARFDVSVAQAGEDLEEAAFDLSLNATASNSFRERASANDATQATSADFRRISAGVDKRFHSGTVLSLSSELERSDNDAQINLGSNLDYDSSLDLSLRQPLWQGAWGEVNLARLRQARSVSSEVLSRLLGRAMDLIAATESAYWDLAAAQARLALRESSLQLAEKLLLETQERERVGLASRIDVLQARATLATRREAIVQARSQIAAQADALFLRMGELQASAPSLDESAAPEVNPLPERVGNLPEFSLSWERALKIEPSLRAQEEVLRQRELDLVRARDQFRPRLDLTVSGSLLGSSDEDSAGAYQSLSERDGYGWSAGIEFSMPWGRREGRALKRQAEARLRREEADLLDLRADLLSRVRGAWRSVANSRERLEAAEATLSLQEALFEQAKAAYSGGLTNLRERLEAQSDLDTARISRLEARLALLNADIELSRLDGRILERHGFAPETLRTALLSTAQP